MTPEPEHQAAAEDEPRHEPLEPDRLTWAVLLSKWTEFAQSSVALPDTGQAGRVRQSVADIITLQAVWFALGQLDELGPGEQALGLDRAGVLIARHTAAIRARFAGEPLPPGLQELIDDARAQYVRHKPR